MGISWGELGNKLINNAKLKRIPISGQFELTSRCNMKCKMCYVSRVANDTEALSNERSAKEWIQLATEARDAGMLYLLLTGGEIFIRPDFKDIYQELSRLGLNIEFYTNATMITPEVARWLGRIPPSRIGVTLYGSSAETYAKVCGNADGYNQACRGIDLLLSEGIKLWLKTTIIKDNTGDFEKLAEFAEKRDIELGIVDYISPRREGCGTHPESVRLSPRELINYENYVDGYFNTKANNKLSLKEVKDCSFENLSPDIKAPTESTPNIPDAFNCLSGKCAFWITWDGRMTPCSLMSTPESHPFQKGFTASWKELQELCFSIPVCTDCRQCSKKAYCMTCPARLQIETGSFDKPADYLCEMAQIKANNANL